MILAPALLRGLRRAARKPAQHVAQGKALLAEGKYEAAAAELSKATALDKNSMDAWLQLGHAYRGLKQYDNALAAYVAAKKIDRHSVAPHVAHAKVQVELGRVELATTELNFVVEMDPKNLEALILLGQVSQMPHKLPDGSDRRLPGEPRARRAEPRGRDHARAAERRGARGAGEGAR